MTKGRHVTSTRKAVLLLQGARTSRLAALLVRRRKSRPPWRCCTPSSRRRINQRANAAMQPACRVERAARRVPRLEKRAADEKTAERRSADWRDAAKAVMQNRKATGSLSKSSRMPIASPCPPKLTARSWRKPGSQETMLSAASRCFANVVVVKAKTVVGAATRRR